MEKKTYCENCGKEEKDVTFETNKYDKKTGRKVFNTKRVCVNYKKVSFWGCGLMQPGCPSAVSTRIDTCGKHNYLIGTCTKCGACNGGYDL